MLLVKCKCGCRFTLDESKKRTRYIKCPDCESQIPIDEETYAPKSELFNVVESVSHIPENAKIMVSFDI